MFSSTLCSLCRHWHARICPTPLLAIYQGIFLDCMGSWNLLFSGSYIMQPLFRFPEIAICILLMGNRSLGIFTFPHVSHCRDPPKEILYYILWISYICWLKRWCLRYQQFCDKLDSSFSLVIAGFNFAWFIQVIYPASPGIGWGISRMAGLFTLSPANQSWPFPSHYSVEMRLSILLLELGSWMLLVGLIRPSLAVYWWVLYYWSCLWWCGFLFLPYFRFGSHHVPRHFSLRAFVFVARSPSQGSCVWIEAPRIRNQALLYQA